MTSETLLATAALIFPVPLSVVWKIPGPQNSAYVLAYPSYKLITLFGVLKCQENDCVRLKHKMRYED